MKRYIKSASDKENLTDMIDQFEQSLEMYKIMIDKFKEAAERAAGDDEKIADLGSGVAFLKDSLDSAMSKYMTNYYKSII